MPVLRQHYIGLNAMLPDPEQEMTAAHEFGHSLLHRNIPDLMQDFDLFNIISQTEYEANLFAAEFLITDHDVVECADEGMDYIEMSKTMSRDPRLMLFKLHSMNQRCGAVGTVSTYLTRRTICF